MSSSESPPPRPDDATNVSSQSPPPDTQGSTPSAASAEPYVCQWIDCSSSFSDPEVLYNHLCNDHIGRKSTNNLCLTCKWKDCGTSCAKRDHITSHLRVHTPLKPHVCEICKKSFKRPQDLKKHEKIHTEEHHAQHKHSKAITVVDPNYVARVRGDAAPQKGVLNKPLSAKVAAPTSAPVPKVPFARARPHPGPVSDGSHFTSLPTPSPELEHTVYAGHHAPNSSYDLLLQNQVPSWDGPKSDTTAPSSTRTKRSYEYSVDDLLADMKKRKVNPSYDTHMAERLNNMAYTEGISQYDDFNPRSVSFDVRTPEELAAVNDFLVTLGRDVTAPPQRSGPGQGTDRYSPYFDDHSLNQLGLAGLPGLPVSGATFTHDTGYAPPASSNQYGSNAYPSPPGIRSSHPSVQQNQYGIYPTLHTPTPSVPSAYSNDHYTAMQPRRVSAPSTHEYALNHNASAYGASQYHTPPHGHFHPTPPLDPTSPHSSSSTPSNATPPHNPTISEGFAQYDYIRSSRGPAPPVQLAAPDYSRKSMHTIIPLKTAAGSVPDPVEPKLSDSVHRGPPARLLPLASSSSLPSLSSSSKIYPVLKPEDADLKLPMLKPDVGQTRLPPLREMYRSPSPPAPRSPSTSRGTTPSSTHSSPVPSHTVLPSLRSITGTSESDELARKVGRIDLTKEVSPEERRKHAELIRNLLVRINEDYRKRYGTPPLRTKTGRESIIPQGRYLDVEMTAA
ncbi:hypothetical protein BV22DRAFT_1028227 [Leucogyrophana mollusca]|uniref:Uncharacterized protein n=1 Tax=Leucogyrophana mollusca TaxID=85980 RepID=A0ACB8BX12_9AGAM|nr:hypothetical protein BV22DRAFT_1028227 [Leucogyrophana mollusca]